MGGQQKDFFSDIVFFQHQDGMRLKVRRHFLQCMVGAYTCLGSDEAVDLAGVQVLLVVQKTGPQGRA
jgi:hypothetical protein